MKINTSLQQSQKQLFAPAMQQSIEMLLLPLVELNMSIDQELQNNPLLEIDEEKLKSSQEHQKDELAALLAYSRHGRHFSPREHSADDEILEDKPIKMEVTLEEQLLQQLRMELSDPLEIKIGEFIIGSLDEDGYLKVTCEEIAQAAGTDDLVRVEYILKIIQNLEPAGIASRSLKECLLSQVKARCNGNSGLIRKIIEGHLDALGRKKYQDIARNSGASLDAVKEAAKAIAAFEPKPARNYRPIKASLYIKPDMFITKDDEGDFHILINNDGVPPLRVNAHYQKMLLKENLNREEKNFIREKLKNALYFMKSIEQRGRTIERITQYILEKQREFFEKGHMFLAPMSLKDIAQSIERNESTISRAIANKYVDTPQGLYPLKFFFSQGVSETENGAVASRSIKEEIKELVDAENKSEPLSDQTIQEYFKHKDICISRRTVSKYRQNLRILPSYLRKN
ncbi:MAG: RNA polymerase sigma-54 factor [Omnitrophica WOR_2 bacterium RIFCSPHIGHO2_02_FULL_52_10]|nr:MAG: RNA polymerase sigma-54 factor [Omnitrophica WOR_2 bacterium RIFCSPHIGHO2_02_FULL_52_10]